MTTPPDVQLVRVYGGDHSPWVQAVLLAVHDLGISHQLETVAVPRVMLRSGALMPAIRMDQEDWFLGSDKALVKLGLEPLASADRKMLFAAWDGVTHRVDSPLGFWAAWQSLGDEHPSRLRRWLHHFVRPFVVLYFLIVVSMLKRSVGEVDVVKVEQTFVDWGRRLGDGRPFIHGDAPNTLDYMLFGIIQCHCSIQVPTVGVLVGSPELEPIREWIVRMQQQLAGYRHLYSDRYFGAVADTSRHTASTFESLLFWAGSMVVVLLLPVTLPLALIYIWRVRRLKLAR